MEKDQETNTEPEKPGNTFPFNCTHLLTSTIVEQNYSSLDFSESCLRKSKTKRNCFIFCHLMQDLSKPLFFPLSETPILSLIQSWFQITFAHVKPNKLLQRCLGSLVVVIQSLVKTHYDK
ncbi:hypothetical protein AMECASPLE_011283 [Ameca splendens]|uniref:Uncharacterized protein n=1 Tax=Ameca splendens TaxID=208324 RepID=A0ABV0ZKG8_9TELE